MSTRCKLISVAAFKVIGLYTVTSLDAQGTKVSLLKGQTTVGYSDIFALDVHVV